MWLWVSALVKGVHVVVGECACCLVVLPCAVSLVVLPSAALGRP